MSTDFLWVEEYRPKTIDDCILPASLKTLFQSFIDKGEISNMLFSGTPGVGKTTVAKALCEQMNCDWIMINGSEEGGIDVLRNKIKNFASTVSLSGGKKVVILDEADYLNPQSCLLYTSDAADEEDSVDLGGRRIIKNIVSVLY